MEKHLGAILAMAATLVSAVGQAETKACDDYLVNCDPEGRLFRFEHSGCPNPKRIKESGFLIRRYSGDVYTQAADSHKVKQASCVIAGKEVSASWVAKPITGKLKGCGKSGKIPVITMWYDGKELIRDMPLAACSLRGWPTDFNYVELYQETSTSIPTLRAQYDYDTRVYNEGSPEITITSQTQIIKEFELYPSKPWNVSRSDIQLK